jgi:hypothetical protein
MYSHLILIIKRPIITTIVKINFYHHGLFTGSVNASISLCQGGKRPGDGVVLEMKTVSGTRATPGGEFRLAYKQGAALGQISKKNRKKPSQTNFFALYYKKL